MNGRNLLFISMLGEDSVYRTGDYQDMCPSGLEKDWILGQLAPMAREFGFQLRAIDICRGDALPPPADVEAVIVGGTAHIVNEDHPWLDDLSGWLQEFRPLGRPLLGICGGHQLACLLFENGTLTYRNSGTLAGTYAVELSESGRGHPLFAGMSGSPRFHFANFLHILPAADVGEKVLASVGESPAIAVDHGGHWYSCQFHPESSKAMWTCFFKREPEVDIGAFTEEHDGGRMVGNFLQIAEQHLRT